MRHSNANHNNYLLIIYSSIQLTLKQSHCPKHLYRYGPIYTHEASRKSIFFSLLMPTVKNRSKMFENEVFRRMRGTVTQEVAAIRRGASKPVLFSKQD